MTATGKALATEVTRLGATFAHAEVFSLQPNTQGTVGLSLVDKRILADYVVLSAGVWSLKLLEPLVLCQRQKILLLHLDIATGG